MVEPAQRAGRQSAMGVQRIAWVALTGALALPLAGCGTGEAAKKAPLSGRVFDARVADGMELPHNSDLRLTFGGFRVNVSGGCNSGSGEYRVEGGLLVVDALTMTEMACDASLMALDDAVSALLVAKPRVQVVGNVLTISSGTMMLTLLDDRVVVPDLPLTGTHWIVESLLDGETVTAAAVPNGLGTVTATLRLADGMVDVFGGCNHGSASAQVASSTIEFGQLNLTEAACDTPLLILEYSVALVVQGTVSYWIDGDRLTLMNGARGLVLRAAPEP